MLALGQIAKLTRAVVSTNLCSQASQQLLRQMYDICEMLGFSDPLCGSHVGTLA